MKILYLITKSEVGGAQTHVHELCNYFRAQHEITVVAYPGGWLEKKCKELNVRFIPNQFFSNSVNPLRVLRSFFAIKKIVKDIQPDVVHCHSSVAGFLGRLAIRNNIPTLYTAHGWGFNIGVGFFQKWMSIIAEKMVSKYTAKIICVSQFVKDLGITYKITLPEKFEVIHNGVALQERKITAHNNVNIIFVGRMAEPKRPRLLLEAIQLLPLEEKKKISVRLVGDGPQLEEVGHYAAEQDMGLVEFLGELPHEQIIAKMHNSDIFVLLSDWEGLPITILEAMSCGLPIISSDVGGISEVVSEDNGRLVRKNTPEFVAQCLEVLIANDTLRQQLGQASYEKVRTDFSLTRMLERTAELYKQY